MSARSVPLTVTMLMAESAEILEAAGFKAANPPGAGIWKATAARLYEDAYSIVCVAVYETWADLSSNWTEDQAHLVNLISEHFARSDAKAWEGYLALLTPSIVPAAERLSAIGIQRNTVHVRKLFADGEELQSPGAIRRTLLALLPLEEQHSSEPANVLDNLPPLLAARGVDAEAAQVAIAAFREQRPIVAEIHALLTSRGQQS